MKRVDASVKLVGSKRRSALLTLRTADGLVGRGEAAPHSARSKETPEACARALEKAARRLRFDPERAGSANDVAAELAAQDAVLDGLPAARFALETALFELVSSARGQPVAECLGGGRAYDVVELNALLYASALPGRGELAAAARAFATRGFRVIKVKLSARDDAGFAAELGELATLRRDLPNVELRLDASGMYGLAEARARLDALAEVGPSYVEDPVAPELIERLGDVKVPLAIDDAVVDIELFERLLACVHLKAVVLKPTLLGGLLRARSLACVAQARGVGVVITHAFEGPIALAAACELALSLDRLPLACGLSRHEALARFSDAALPSFHRETRLVRRVRPHVENVT